VRKELSSAVAEPHFDFQCSSSAVAVSSAPWTDQSYLLWSAARLVTSASSAPDDTCSTAGKRAYVRSSATAFFIDAILARFFDNFMVSVWHWRCSPASS
jgi:hypothetical protein